MKREPVPITLEKDGVVLEFPSIRAAAMHLGVHQSLLVAAHKSYRGWKITRKTPRKTLPSSKVYVFRVHGESLKLELVHEFSSINSTARYFGVSAGEIHNLMRIGYKFRGEFIFRYQKDGDDVYDPNDFI